MQNPALAELRQQTAAELAPILAAIRSPIPFFLSGIAATWAGWHTGQNLDLILAYTLFAYLLGLMTVIDIRHGILPHMLTGTLMLVGAVIAPTLGLTYMQSLYGSLVGMGGLFACGFLAEKLSGRPALGGGDLWLVGALGAWLGVGGLPMLLLATAFTGVISILVRNWVNGGQTSKKGKTFPFGPALCAAGWLALLYAPSYWRFMEMLTSTAS